jgi:DNA-binding transcriptional ArsR family regulator
MDICAITPQVIGFRMHAAPDALLRTLADPTWRSIFERLCRDGEQTVRGLTDHSGVSQPAVSKHLMLFPVELTHNL